MVIGAGLLVLGGIALMGSPDGNPDGFALGIALVLAAGLYVLLARGLWQMRNWARVLIVVFQGLGLALGLLALIGGDSHGLIGMPVGAYVLYWFAKNGDKFN